MPKTPDEIKKGLIEAIEETIWVVDGGDAHDLRDACDMAHASMADALALIQRLEDDIDMMADKLTRMHESLPRWIPVSERLPEQPGEVLVSIAKYTVIAFFRCDGKFETAGGVVFKAGDMLTHWMPKPEPAKEETK